MTERRAPYGNEREPELLDRIGCAHYTDRKCNSNLMRAVNAASGKRSGTYRVKCRYCGQWMLVTVKYSELPVAVDASVMPESGAG